MYMSRSYIAQTNVLTIAVKLKPPHTPKSALYMITYKSTVLRKTKHLIIAVQFQEIYMYILTRNDSISFSSSLKNREL